MQITFSIPSFFCLVLPSSKLKNFILRMMGWEVSSSCKIGFSWISAKKISMYDNVRIGSFNFISIERLILKRGANIGHLNKITGPFWLVLGERSSIGNENRVIRARKGVSWGKSILRLGYNSKITSGHIIDCTRRIKFGDNSILAGRSSQLWTHGYLHAPSGEGRFRIDGAISIGSNVYIGSACVINAGLRISSGITVGASSCVSSSLLDSGLYVSQPLRFIPLDYDSAFKRYSSVKVEGLVEDVKIKKW
ncbi:acyltransferase [Pseudomonas defluvii]|uniref:acyltransferase n=1 Tax=Pseudomonas defluvii TaxID=1876757 RepID=UPI00390692BF